jgi:hypothetical protein
MALARNSPGARIPHFSSLAGHLRNQVSMSLISLVITLIVVGVLLWLVSRFIPMQSNIKSILNGVVVIGVILWLLNIFGLFHGLSKIHIG